MMARKVFFLLTTVLIFSLLTACSDSKVSFSIDAKNAALSVIDGKELEKAVSLLALTEQEAIEIMGEGEPVYEVANESLTEVGLRFKGSALDPQGSTEVTFGYDEDVDQEYFEEGELRVKLAFSVTLKAANAAQSAAIYQDLETLLGPATRKFSEGLFSHAWMGDKITFFMYNTAEESIAENEKKGGVPLVKFVISGGNWKTEEDMKD